MQKKSTSNSAPPVDIKQEEDDQLDDHNSDLDSNSSDTKPNISIPAVAALANFNQEQEDAAEEMDFFDENYQDYVSASKGVNNISGAFSTSSLNDEHDGDHDHGDNEGMPRLAHTESDASLLNPLHSVISPFVAKLANMLKNLQFQNFVSWNEKGDTVLVKNVKEFSSYVLPKYFKHKNFTSFLRQLNMYGFCTIRQGPNWREFKNDLFTKHKPERYSKMKRRNAQDSLNLNIAKQSMNPHVPIQPRTSTHSAVSTTNVNTQQQQQHVVAHSQPNVEDSKSDNSAHRKRKKDEFKGGKVDPDAVKQLEARCEQQAKRIDTLENRVSFLESRLNQLVQTLSSSGSVANLPGFIKQNSFSSCFEEADEVYNNQPASPGNRARTFSDTFIDDAFDNINESSNLFNLDPALNSNNNNSNLNGLETASLPENTFQEFNLQRTSSLISDFEIENNINSNPKVEIKFRLPAGVMRPNVRSGKMLKLVKGVGSMGQRPVRVKAKKLVKSREHEAFVKALAGSVGHNDNNSGTQDDTPPNRVKHEKKKSKTVLPRSSSSVQDDGL